MGEAKNIYFTCLNFYDSEFGIVSSQKNVALFTVLWKDCWNDLKHE